MSRVSQFSTTRIPYLMKKLDSMQDDQITTYAPLITFENGEE